MNGPSSSVYCSLGTLSCPQWKKQTKVRLLPLWVLKGKGGIYDGQPALGGSGVPAENARGLGCLCAGAVATCIILSGAKDFHVIFWAVLGTLNFTPGTWRE